MCPRNRKGTGNSDADFSSRLPVDAAEYNVHGSNRITNDQKIYAFFLVSDLPDSFADFLSGSTRALDLSTKTGEVSVLPRVPLTEDDFYTYPSRGLFLPSVTDPATVAAVSPLPFADRIPRRTRSRLTVASCESLYTSHSRTLASPPSVNLCGEVSNSDRTTSGTATATSS